MTKTDFFAELQELLQTDAPIDGNIELASLEEWDSVAFMVIIAFFDKYFEKKITFEGLAACKTPEDLVLLSEGGVV